MTLAKFRESLSRTTFWIILKRVGLRTNESCFRIISTCVLNTRWLRHLGSIKRICMATSHNRGLGWRLQCVHCTGARADLEYVSSKCCCQSGGCSRLVEQGSATERFVTKKLDRKLSGDSCHRIHIFYREPRAKFCLPSEFLRLLK